MSYLEKYKEFLARKRARRAQLEREKEGLEDAELALAKWKPKGEILYRKMKDSEFREKQKEKLPQKKITEF